MSQTRPSAQTRDGKPLRHDETVGALQGRDFVSTVAYMDENLASMGEEELRAMLLECDATLRAAFFEGLCAELGSAEASRRWLAAFSGVDAAET